MKKQQKWMLVFAMITVFVAAVLFLPGLIGAGDLDPSGPPGSTMHTLEDIHNLFPPAAVEKTGHMVDGGYSDGGRGVPWPVPRFTDNGNGTVRDNLTGLIWLKQANYNSTGGGTGTATWTSAIFFCNALANGMCGLSDGSNAGDWRLPNIKELESLIDYGNYGPALPSGHPFVNVQAGYYWSSTTYATNTYDAWSVGMGHGSVVSSNKDAGDVYVWPVRAGN